MRALLIAVVLLLSASAVAGAPPSKSRDDAPFVHFDLEAPATGHPEVQLRPLASLTPALSSVERAFELAAATKAQPRERRIDGYHEEARVLWYAAGATGLTSLASRVLLAGPTYLIGALSAGAGLVLNPVAGTVLTLAMFGTFTVVDSALSALMGSVLFNNLSDVYETTFLPGFLGHLAGNALAVGATRIIFGFGGMLIGGLGTLSPFLGSGIVELVAVFSMLGVLPALVVTFIASLAVPAIMSTWAMAATAKAKAGYEIDPTWRPSASPSERALPEKRRLPVFVTLPLPAPGT